MFFLVPIFTILSWLGLVSAQPASSQTVTQTVSSAFERRQLWQIADSDVVIQPWLLTDHADAKIKPAWQHFYDQLPQELRSVIRPPIVLPVDANLLIKGQAFADQLDAKRLQVLFSAQSPATIPVVYTDFDFSSPYHFDAATGIYFRQQYDYLTVAGPTDSYSAASETSFLTWLAYLHL